MTDFAAQAESWIADKMRKHLARPVTYSRGVSSVSLLATIGRTQPGADDLDGGSILYSDQRDYVVAAADLVLNGANVLPQLGDRITDTLSGRQVVFVVAAETGERCWRYADAYEVSLRIHVKRLEVA